MATSNKTIITPTATSPVQDDILQYKSGEWVPRTIAQLKVDIGEVSEADSDIHLNAKDYDVTGDGVTDDYTALNTLITSLGSTPTEIYFPTGTYVVGSNLTLPATVKVILAFNARLKVSATKTLTIFSRFQADDRQNIFTGAGSVLFHPGSVKYVSVMWWGAIPDGSTDSATAFQSCINQSQLVGRVYIPGGTPGNYYKISSTVSFYSPTRVFSAWEVFGDIGSDESQYQELTSKIKYTGTSGPCFNFRGQRLSKIHDFALRGTNAAPGIIANDNGTDTWDANNWITSGLSGDRYDHLCGIAFDWVGGSGTSTPWSAQVDVYNLNISEFVVGISISPNSGYQADTIDCTKVKIRNCVYGVSVGQDQARACNFTNMWMDNCFCAYTNKTFGRANGSSFNVFGGQYTGIFKIFDVITAYRGAMVVTGMFIEACGMLGSVDGLGVNNNAAVFTGCELNFDNEGYQTGASGHYSTPWLWLLAGSNVTFTGCNIKSAKGWLGTYCNYDGRITFIGCSFPAMSWIYEAGDSIRQNRVRFENCTQNNSGVFEFSDNPTLETTEKKYVRANITSVRTYNAVTGSANGQYVNNFIVSGHRPNWSPNLSAALATNPANTYQVTGLTSATTAYYKVGDILMAYIGTEVAVTGTPLTVGGLMAPCLKVTDVQATSVTVQKLGPEVDLTKTTSQWGYVYTYGKAWVSIKKVTGTFDATNQAISVTNVSTLAVGDWVNIGYGDNLKSARVTAISGTTVTFSNTVAIRGIHEIYGIRLINAFTKETDYQSGSGAPSVNARYTGDRYFDTAGQDWYDAIAVNSSTASNDWKIRN
jgi:LEA14-like dessication related protein